MKIVILGCGRVGARLAQLMEASGHDVSIIDSDPAAFDRLPDNFNGQTVLGTGIDVDVLKSAGIATADAFAAVTNYDNTNIMACEVAKEIFGVKQVLARIYDPGREGMYHQLGLETICPTTLVSTTAHDILLSAFSQVAAAQEAQQESAGDGQLTPAAAATVTPPTMSIGSIGPGLATNGSGEATKSQQSLQDQQVSPVRHVAVPDDESAAGNNGRGIRGLFRH
ncbi:MAG: TrkA family potassium uptake protein [Chloroflexi bacterium]|nr:TrkA family potassium uptake protein [Chloroflexota bacterium]